MAWQMPYFLSNLHAASCELGYKCCTLDEKTDLPL